MRRGITFEIPNDYGSFLGDILKPLDTAGFDWYIGGEESYLVDGGRLDNPLFSREIIGMDGGHLKDIIENNKYYLIFQDLKAFPKGKAGAEVRTYKEYLDSACQLALLVIDSSYITVYCKDGGTLESLHQNAKVRGYSNLDYITDDNDMRTHLTVW
ncbi:DUF2691 family protein [Paenibacillus tuaregi]|uniref:DUF2691 family protein n=1 Tax=Paenibacillus tuaregi TaxID=1816681 RepID=UPI000837EE48|nr:DUF2691 family protein [Paenibacillus tuaregi]